MKKIFYIGYYGDSLKKRTSAPSADTKMDYIINCLNRNNYEVEVLSFSSYDNKKCIYEKQLGYERKIDQVKIRYFTSYTSKFKFIRFIGKFFTWIEQKKFIKKRIIDNNCIVIIYHSLELFKLYKFLNKNKINYIFEIEEIYSDVINDQKLRKREINYLVKGDKFIFPTNLLNEEINLLKKPYVVVHGTYKNEKNFYSKSKNTKVVHCVYAGTLDSRKGGSRYAILAAPFLPSNYHVHILGFGNEKQIQELKKSIDIIRKKSKAKITYDGVLYGIEYLKFLQKCDIGLSTQNPNASFNSTSFPSKILSYMSNGLRVVSIRIPVVEQSDISNYIYYYENQEPKEIADAIMSVNLNDSYNSKKIIQKLNKKFTKEMYDLIEK